MPRVGNNNICAADPRQATRAHQPGRPPQQRSRARLQGLPLLHLLLLLEAVVPQRVGGTLAPMDAAAPDREGNDAQGMQVRHDDLPRGDTLGPQYVWRAPDGSAKHIESTKAAAFPNGQLPLRFMEDGENGQLRGW